MKRQGYTSTQQREQLLALGAVLRAAREAKGLSLDGVAKTALIRARLLMALEEAYMDELPELIYVRGLIRRYGNVLGLDGELLASQYVAPPPTRGPHQHWWNNQPPQLRPFHLYGAYVALIALSVSGLSYLMQQAIPQNSAEPILDPASVEQLMPQSRPRTVTSKEAEPTKVKISPKEPIMVDVAFVQQSWVRVTADGDEAYEGILQEGAERSWTAKKSLTIRAGNAGGVVIAYNQGSAKPMGKPGTVVEQTFTPPSAVASLAP